jgi:hypothetical protein
MDPFMELTIWVQGIDRELRLIHRLVSEASALDAQLRDAASLPVSVNDYQMIGQMMNPRPNIGHLRTRLNATMQELNQRITALKNQ